MFEKCPKCGLFMNESKTRVNGVPVTKFVFPRHGLSLTREEGDKSWQLQQTD